MRDDEVHNEMNNEPSESGEDRARAAERPGKLRQRVLVGALVVLCGLWGAEQFAHQRLRADAAPLVDAAEDEHRGPGVETASRLVVAREWPFFGTPVAKVEVFIRDAERGPDGPIGGVQYEYAFLDGDWKLLNSAGCHDEECAIRGREAFGL